MGNGSEWSTQEAKSKFSDLLAQAEKEPQTIMDRGQKRVVVIAMAEFEQMTKDLQELRKQFKKAKVQSLQNQIQDAFKDAGREGIKIDRTPTRAPPEFD